MRRRVARIGKQNKGSIYFTQLVVNWEYTGSGSTYTTKAFIAFPAQRSTKTTLPIIEEQHEEFIKIDYATNFLYEDGIQEWKIKIAAQKPVRILAVGDEQIGDVLAEGETKEYTLQTTTEAPQLTFTQVPGSYIHKRPLQKWPPYGFIIKETVRIEKPVVGHGAVALANVFSRYRIIRNIEDPIVTTVTPPEPVAFPRPISVIAWPRIGPKRTITDTASPPRIDLIPITAGLPLLASVERNATGSYGG